MYCDHWKHEIHQKKVRYLKIYCLPGRKAHCLSITKTNRLMPFVQLIFVLHENHAKHKQAVQSGYNIFFLIFNLLATDFFFPNFSTFCI